MQTVDDTGYVRTRRMHEQRWLLDNVIRVSGVDWDQGRTRYTAYPCGLDAQADFARVRERVRKFADIHREFAAAARRRELLAEEADRVRDAVSAREHSLVASILWGNAEWPLFGDSSLLEEYRHRKHVNYDRYRGLSAHPIRVAEIPFAHSTLPGYLHLPAHGEPPFPCAIQIGGMDSFKEHRVAMYGDKFLERGVACLAVEIPGQGDCLARGLGVTATSAVEAGRSILDWLRVQTDIDPARIALTGNSFGSFWATQIAATADGLVGCAVTGVIHEPGMHAIFETASPTFKARFMYMAGYRDEDAFDEFASTLDLTDLAPNVSCPYLALAGEDDELSPLANTLRLLELMPAPAWLVVYQGERHSLGGGPAAALGPNPTHLVAQWLAGRFAGIPASDRCSYVETTGQVTEREPGWRTGRADDDGVTA